MERVKVIFAVLSQIKWLHFSFDIYMEMVAMVLGTSRRRAIQSKSIDLEDKLLNLNREDLICPICLDFPHNAVLLQCSSYEKGCRPFVCDTNHTHSNCLDRYKAAYGLSEESIKTNPSSLVDCPPCPLCRGEVRGWFIINEARAHLNMKRRCCEEKHCTYVGNYMELQTHAKLNHPHSRPSEIDPARQRDWEKFQQSLDIIDVLTTINAEMPNGVVCGDYVIEYEVEDLGDDYAAHRIRGNWWTSCVLYKAIKNFQASRRRRRSSARESRRSHNGSSSSSSNPEVGSTTSSEVSVNRYVETDDEFAGSGYGAVSFWSEVRSYSCWRQRRVSLP